MKKFVFFIMLVFVLTACHSKKVELSDIIINEINANSAAGQPCVLSIKDLTSFEWDRAVIFSLGSSNVEISEKLGVEFTELKDLTNGMIFTYNGDIVYKEYFPYHPEKPNKLRIKLGSEFNRPTCIILTTDNLLMGNRTEIDGKYYYSIEPA